MNIKLVPTTKEIIPQLAECFRMAYKPLGEEWSNERALEFITFKFDRYPDLSFAALLDGEPVGGIFSDMKPWCDGNHLCEGEVYILPKHQSKGIGKMLIYALLETAKKKYNCQIFESVTFREGHQLKMWEKIGCKEDPTFTFFTGEIDVMLKNLK